MYKRQETGLTAGGQGDTGAAGAAEVSGLAAAFSGENLPYTICILCGVAAVAAIVLIRIRAGRKQSR